MQRANVRSSNHDVVRLGDVVQQVKDVVDAASSDVDRYVAGEHLDGGDLRTRRWGVIGDGYLGPAFHMRFRPGHVLYGSRRTYLRKVAVADFAGVCANTTFVLEPKGDKLIADLLPFVLSSDRFVHFSVQQSRGSVNPYVNFSDLTSFEFDLPSLEQQRSIAGVLNAAASTVAAWHEAAQRAQLTWRALLNTICVGSLGVSPQDSELSPECVPSGWTIQSASEVCSAPIVSGTTPRSGQTTDQTGIPFIKVQHLSFSGDLAFEADPSFLTHAAAESAASCEVRPGDVLTNIVGPPLGKVAVIPTSMATAIVNQAIVRFRLPRKEMQAFLRAYLLSDWAKAWLFRRSTKTSGQRNINVTTCRALPVPVPPDDVLVDAVAKLEAAERNVRLVDEQHKAASALLSELRENLLFGTGNV